MTKFLTDRDKLFFQSINNELIDDVITTPVIIYKPFIENSDVHNVFEESINKVWKIGIRLNCIIDRSNKEQDTNEYGINIHQDIKFAFNREEIKETNIYPEIGDIVEWNEFYYEVQHVYENQYLAGRENSNWSIVVDGHLTNKSLLNIEEIHR